MQAVIIKGNPKFIRNNPVAESFYAEIKEFLEKLGFEVIFSSGQPYTSPPAADLWIGHSRGVDRLRFAPSGTKTLALGSSLKGAVNHPLDNTKDIQGPSNIIPNKYHYVFTPQMKKRIKDLQKQIFTG